MHLSKGEYARAVEAFTRSLVVSPTRTLSREAKAYRGLAALDERQARAL